MIMIMIKKFPVLRGYAETGQGWPFSNDMQI
jgi:hypothetical protein